MVMTVKEGKEVFGHPVIVQKQLDDNLFSKSETVFIFIHHQMTLFIIFILCRIVEFPRGTRQEGPSVPELLRHQPPAFPLQSRMGINRKEERSVFES